MTSSHPQLLLDFSLGGARALDRYVAGPNAEVLARLSDGVVEPGFRCVWIHGPTGVGKTHLLQGTCQAATSAGQRAVYLPGALLADGGLPEPVPNAVGGLAESFQILGGLDEFAVVALDDLEDWLDVGSADEALLALYQRLLGREAMLLVASTVAPQQLAVTLADLESRLRAASCYQLRELADPEKQTLLARFAEDRGLTLPVEVGRYLLERGARDVTTLLTNLERVERAAYSEHRQLTVPLVRRVLES